MLRVKVQDLNRFLFKDFSVKNKSMTSSFIQKFQSKVPIQRKTKLINEVLGTNTLVFMVKVEIKCSRTKLKNSPAFFYHRVQTWKSIKIANFPKRRLESIRFMKRTDQYRARAQKTSDYPRFTALGGKNVWS